MSDGASGGARGACGGGGDAGAAPAGEHREVAPVDPASLGAVGEGCRRDRGRHFVIGSRSSALAMWQAVHVRDALAAAWPGLTFEIRTEATIGDAVLDRHLSALATAASPGVFTKELEAGLLSGGYDLAVHSLKDMPTTLPAGCTLAAISAREDARDVICLAPQHAHLASADGLSVLAALPPGSVVGTSSLRREALLRHLAPHVTAATVRGNLNTRFRKLYEGPTAAPVGAPPPVALPPSVSGAAPSARPPAHAPAATTGAGTPLPSAAGVAGDAASCDAAPAPAAALPYDALLLAAAGVVRLGWRERVSGWLDPSDWPYGVGQGALGIETRADDEQAQQ
jgi:porphobilinogen deaminase